MCIPFDLKHCSYTDLLFRILHGFTIPELYDSLISTSSWRSTQETDNAEAAEPGSSHGASPEAISKLQKLAIGIARAGAEAEPGSLHGQESQEGAVPPAALISFHGSLVCPRTGLIQYDNQGIPVSPWTGHPVPRILWRCFECGDSVPVNQAEELEPFVRQCGRLTCEDCIPRHTSWCLCEGVDPATGEDELPGDFANESQISKADEAPTASFRSNAEAVIIH
jgi:hypothetical protein